MFKIKDLSKSNVDTVNKCYFIIINYVHYRDKHQLNLINEFSQDLKGYISYKLNTNSNLSIRLPDYDENYRNMKSYAESVVKAVSNFVNTITNSLVINAINFLFFCNLLRL